MSSCCLSLDEDMPDCPICGKKDIASFCFVKNGHSIFRCSDCCLMFVHPQPEKATIRSIYDAGYFERGKKYSESKSHTGKSANSMNNRKRLTLVQEFRESGCLLDVGCAKGGFLQMAGQNGFEVTGVELSENASSYARKELGLRVLDREFIESGLPSGHFDVVTMWDVFEHLPDPAGNLREAHRVLCRDGILLLSTGDVSSPWARLTGRRWPLMTPPQHLFFYSPNSLRVLLSRTGFSCGHLSRPGRWASMEFLLFKAHESFGMIVKPFQWLVRRIRMNNCSVYFKLGDVMTCVAGKQGQVNQDA